MCSARRQLSAFVGAALHLALLAAHAAADSVGFDDSDADLNTRLKWAEEWLTTEFNVSTVSLEVQLREMHFFIRKAEPYRGWQIRVVSEDILTHRYERDVIAKFFSNITGIDIVHVIQSEDRVVSDISEQVATGNNLFDAYVSDSDLIGTHWRSCAVTPISDWVMFEGANVTLPSLDIHDFIGIDLVKTPDGKIYQLPDQQFANLYWFRYDLFTDPALKSLFRQKYGYELGVPLDWTAYEHIAEFFTYHVREVNGTRIYGHMDYGKNDASLGWRFHDAWLSMAGAGDIGEPNGLPVDEWGIRVEACRPVGASVERGGAVNSPASIFAATKYLEWQLKYAPPGTLSLNFSTSGGYAAGGQIAQQIFWYTTFTRDMLGAPNMSFPDGSPKWRMAPSPHGPYWQPGQKIGYQDVGSWTLLESTPLERRRAAWLYAQFTVCKSISLTKTLYGLTPIRETDVWSEAMDNLTTSLGGLVEFYRSPDRKRWSPTGTNVPDYPKLAPLWWRNIGQATLEVARGVDPRTAATKAMDLLAHDMDAMLFRIGQASGHPCAPKLGPMRPQPEWLREPGAPKEALKDEMPPGTTMDYDTLVQAWLDGLSLNYDFGPGPTRLKCIKNSTILDSPVAQEDCAGRFFLDKQCVPSCPDDYVANTDMGICEPRDPVEHRLVNSVHLTVGWGVNEVGFFTDVHCRDRVMDFFEVISSGDYAVDTSRLYAFDGLVNTAWISSCTSCRRGDAWIGRLHPPTTVVRCLKLFQYTGLGSSASRFSLERNRVEVQTYDSEGGAWERWPKPAAGLLWRLTNGMMTDRRWVLSEVSLFSDESCTTRIDANFTVDASPNWTGLATHPIDGRMDSSWTSACTRCPIGTAFVEFEFDEPIPATKIQCVKVLQQWSQSSMLLQRWSGLVWETQLTLNGIGGGLGDPVQQRPMMPDTLWRLRALDLDGWTALDGWQIFEFRMCSDGRCASPLRNCHAIASGEASSARRAEFAIDGSFATWWAGGDNGPQWIGLWCNEPQKVECFQIWQSSERWATGLVLERWDGQNWAASNVLQYRPAGSGYFSSCNWGAHGTFWRITHAEPVNGIWRIHEVELFTDENCSLRISPEHVITASGQPTWNSQNHLRQAMDRRQETFTTLCERETICQPETQYVGVDFVTPETIRCIRIFQSGARGKLLLQQRLGPGGEALAVQTSVSRLEERLEAISRSDFTPVFSESIITLEASNARWSQAIANESKEFADCRNEPFTTLEGWCQTCGCITCNIGFEPSVDDEAHICAKCDKGRYSDILGHAVCEACQPGTFGNETGLTACHPCPPGSFSAEGKETQCAPCPAGSVQPLPGQDHCELCSLGFLSHEIGMTTCSVCPWSRTSRQGAAECHFDGWYLFWSVSLALSGCIASFLLLTAWRYSIPIEDAFTEEGHTTVILAGLHWLLSPETACCCPRRFQVGATRTLSALREFRTRDDLELAAADSSGPLGTAVGSFCMAQQLPRVRMVGTKVYWIEEGTQFRVSVVSRTRVKLLDIDGKHLTRPVETSIGKLRVPFFEVMTKTGVVFIPAWAVVAVCGVIISVCPSAGRLGWPLTLAVVSASSLTGACAYWYRTHRVLITNHAERLQRFCELLRRKNPSPKPCPRGPERAVTAGQLWQLYEYFHGVIGERDMYYVTNNILKPLTKASQLSYAELAGPTELTWFVSHYWGTPFRSFVESVRKHAESMTGLQREYSPTSVEKSAPIKNNWRHTAYWICSLGNNQWRVHEELGDNWDESSFFLAMRSTTCRGTAMIIDRDALPLTRSWCLFEVLQTFQLKSEVASFEGLALCTDAGVLNQGNASVDTVLAVTERLANLRLENAQASMESDKKMIDGLVVSTLGGFGEMNHFVKRHIHSALMAARNHFEEQFEDLSGQLAEPVDASRLPTKASELEETAHQVSQSTEDCGPASEHVNAATLEPKDGGPPSERVDIKISSDAAVFEEAICCEHTERRKGDSSPCITTL